MTLNDLIEKLHQFNKDAPAGVEKLDVATVEAALAKMGAHVPGALAHMTSAMLVGVGVPALLAEMIVAEAKGVTAQVTSAPAAPAFTAAAPVQPPTFILATDEPKNLTDAVLISRYDPENPGPVGDELNARAGGRAFMIYDGAALVQGATEEVLRLVRKGRPVDDYYDLGSGRTARLRRVGESPQDQPLVENPLRPGAPLNEPGESCPQTHLSWKGVPLTVRQILRYALELGDLVLRGPEDTRNVITLAQKADAEAVVRARYRRAAATFDETPEANRPMLQLAPTVERGGAPRPPFQA